jgi:hypothetical protein
MAKTHLKLCEAGLRQSQNAAISAASHCRGQRASKMLALCIGSIE